LAFPGVAGLAPAGGVGFAVDTGGFAAGVFLPGGAPTADLPWFDAAG
jgi:hypothetical protein